MNPQMMAQALMQRPQQPYQALPPGATGQPDLMGTPQMPPPATPPMAPPDMGPPMAQEMPPGVPGLPPGLPSQPPGPPVAMMGGGPANGMGMRPMSQAPGVRPF